MFLQRFGDAWFGRTLVRRLLPFGLPRPTHQALEIHGGWCTGNLGFPTGRFPTTLFI